MGPCLGSFFEVFCIKVAEAQRFGFNEALWLMAAGRATREALFCSLHGSKPVLFRFCGLIFGSQNVRFPDPELGPSEEAVL